MQCIMILNASSNLATDTWNKASFVFYKIISTLIFSRPKPEKYLAFISTYDKLRQNIFAECICEPFSSLSVDPPMIQIQWLAITRRRAMFLVLTAVLLVFFVLIYSFINTAVKRSVVDLIRTCKRTTAANNFFPLFFHWFRSTTLLFTTKNRVLIKFWTKCQNLNSSYSHIF